MSDECVVGVFENVESADEALRTLGRSELPTEQLSLVSLAQMERPEILEELKIGDDSLHDAAVGAGLGGAIGLLGGTAIAFATGPLSALFIVGPLAGMFSAATGAFLGSLAGWGVHQDHIRHYEHLVEQGKVLVIVHGDPVALARADRMLNETDAVEVHVHARTSAESPEVGSP